MAMIHHRTFRVNWTLDKVNPMGTVQKVCFYGQVWLFRASILF